MKTSELTGVALDWAVAKCEGVEVRILERQIVWPEDYAPSTDWAQGGPIIQQEKIDVMYEHDMRWIAVPQKGVESHGPTPLIAAMRCYVASKLGDDIEIPKDLK
tara:strand:+ start:2700 stop:3011 length:312 start_codon:yes stop_codon:yes gene_type:complete